MKKKPNYKLIAGAIFVDVIVGGGLLYLDFRVLYPVLFAHLQPLLIHAKAPF